MCICCESSFSWKQSEFSQKFLSTTKQRFVLFCVFFARWPYQ
jgi:hypothetical protein